jgi:hypothetical protein
MISPAALGRGCRFLCRFGCVNFLYWLPNPWQASSRFLESNLLDVTHVSELERDSQLTDAEAMGQDATRNSTRQPWESRQGNRLPLDSTLLSLSPFQESHTSNLAVKISS